MRLSWNEIRARAAAFATEWRGAHYERGQTQTFYNEFFEIFGTPRKRVASFEEPVKKLGNKQGFIDLFWKGVLLVEHKSAGRSLAPAKSQALDYFPGLTDAELPRYILVSDFQLFELYDLETNAVDKFPLSDLPHHVEAFGFIMGVQKRVFKDQDPVNIIASELMGRLHDALLASGYAGHDLERLLVRLLFCLFADDTGIFDLPGMFQDLIADRTREDGSDLGLWLTRFFAILNTPIPKRQKSLDEDLARFPYVNGDLFSETLQFPDFNAPMRKILLEACAFNWSAIFGALFQSVMDPKTRRKQGAHYTTEKNILKVIEPLFLDDLRAEFSSLRARRGAARKRALEAFLEKLGALTFFDPACGCGNFLIIAYRELRTLELEILKELHPLGQRELDVAILSKIDVDQFYGIEISEFPSRIAEVALWMMDHIMNNLLSLEFGKSYLRIPLQKSPHILNADALETDWATLLPPEKCSFVYGNPPYVGKKEQTSKQKVQVNEIFRGTPGSGELDYAACWFELAAKYIARNLDVRVAFVSTKSITQGEQVGPIWKRLLFKHHITIGFAHRTFEWETEARGGAHVHVVIVGFSKSPKWANLRLFDYIDVRGEPTEYVAKNINPYLVDGPNIIIDKARAPLTERTPISKGSEATDFGYLTLSQAEREEIINTKGFDPSWIRPFIGGDEYINGVRRYCLWLVGAKPEAIRACPSVLSRMASVKNSRAKSDKARTREWAKRPSLFSENRQPSNVYILIPKVSSQKREYIPTGFVEPDAIVSGSAQYIQTADGFVFSVITSSMHMSWMRAVGGRTKSDYQYTNTLVYNTFPWPEATPAQKQKIEFLGQAILTARANYPEATLADLYDPDTMPPDLRRAHKTLDTAIDKLYRPAGFTSDRERVEHLFTLYEKLTAPALAAMAAPKPKRRPRQKRN